MKNLIMGTAGHIDHGKTALIKALTNYDCDTHPEEKSRGITINLGFTHLELSGGNSIGIVDVPGHSDFIDTMVAGASGIDFVLLVIAADSGVMPQTIEHLRIMESLGVKRGVVALTKIDRVEEDVIQMAESEISELLKGTFLNNCPFVKVSAITGDGLDLLRDKLDAIAKGHSERDASENFRMYIDRIFTKKGFGTVVTGSSLGGMLKKDDHVFILPEKKEVRVRKIERHGIEVEQAAAGSRIALNLAGLNKEDYKRGMIVSDRLIPPTNIADANLRLFYDAKGLELWSQVTFITGTYKCQARVHLLDTDKLIANEEAVAQIHFPDPCIILRGDKFIIRNSSESVTLGGGEILDAFPLHHRRRPEKLINDLKELSKGDLPSYIAAEVKKTKNPVSFNQVSRLTGLSSAELNNIDSADLPSGIFMFNLDDDTFLIREKEREKIQKKILNSIKNYHKRNPLNEAGRSLDELLGLIRIEWNNIDKKLLDFIIQGIARQKLIKKVKSTWVVYDHEVKLTDKDNDDIEFIENFIESSGNHTPLLSELNDAAGKRKISESMLNQILFLLVSQNKIYNIDGNFLHRSIVEESREKLVKYLSENEEGITVAEFRDLIDANRKLCLLLFSQFEKEGIMFRAGDVRILTDSGNKIKEEG